MNKYDRVSKEDKNQSNGKSGWQMITLAVASNCTDSTDRNSEWRGTSKSKRSSASRLSAATLASWGQLVQNLSLARLSSTWGPNSQCQCTDTKNKKQNHGDKASDVVVPCCARFEYGNIRKYDMVWRALTNLSRNQNTDWRNYEYVPVT